jgi:hypothetical protein
MWRWLERFAGAMRFSDGARLADTWIGSDGMVVALLDAPKVEDFDWAVEETAKELLIPREGIELIELSGSRERFTFMGDPAVPDPSLRDPHPVGWNRVDVGPDDRTLRIEYIHGVDNDIHSVKLDEDDYTVAVTVFLGSYPPQEGIHGVVLVGIVGWASLRTKDPVGRRRILDGADL